jgi:co-chaperonin GroES (HSP10)
MARLQPLNNNALIALDSRKETSNGGIYIPEVAQRAETWGTVRAVGDKCEELAHGDRVYVAPHLGTHYIDNGEDFIVIPESKVVCREMREGESIKQEFRNESGEVVGVKVTDRDGNVTTHGEVPA